MEKGSIVSIENQISNKEKFQSKSLSVPRHIASLPNGVHLPFCGLASVSIPCGIIPGASIAFALFNKNDNIESSGERKIGKVSFPLD